MGTGFYGPPVVAGGQRNRVNAVHDALVVGGGPIRVNARKIIGHDNAVAHLLAIKSLAGQLFYRNAYFGPDQRAIGQVGQNAQKRSEEHTSELQSRGHLVCRLLLEKQKMQGGTGWT